MTMKAYTGVCPNCGHDHSIPEGMSFGETELYKAVYGTGKIQGNTKEDTIDLCAVELAWLYRHNGPAKISDTRQSANTMAFALSTAWDEEYDEVMDKLLTAMDKVLLGVERAPV